MYIFTVMLKFYFNSDYLHHHCLTNFYLIMSLSGSQTFVSLRFLGLVHRLVALKNLALLFLLFFFFYPHNIHVCALLWNKLKQLDNRFSAAGCGKLLNYTFAHVTVEKKEKMRVFVLMWFVNKAVIIRSGCFPFKLMRPERRRWISLGGSDTYSVKSWWAEALVWPERYFTDP